MAISLSVVPQDGDEVGRTYLEEMLDTAQAVGLGPECFRAGEVGLVQGTTQSLSVPYLVRFAGPFPHESGSTEPLVRTVAARGYDTTDLDYRVFGWRAHALATGGFLAPALRTQVTLTGTSASHLGTPMRPGADREWAVVPDYSLQKYVTWRLPHLSPHTRRNADSGTAFSGGRRTLLGPRGAFLDAKFLAVADTLGDAVNFYIADGWRGHTSLAALPPIGPASGSGDAQLRRPEDVCLLDPGLDVEPRDRYRYAAIADTGNNRISVWWVHYQIWSYDGDLTEKERTWFQNFGAQGSGEGQFQQPVSVAAVQNRFFVCDRGNNRLVRLGFSYNPESGSPVSLWWDGSIAVADPVCVRRSPDPPHLVVTSGSTGKLYRVNAWSLSITQDAVGAGTAPSLFQGVSGAVEYSLAHPDWAGPTLPIFTVETGRPRLGNWTPFRRPVPRGAVVRLQGGVDLRSTNYTLGYFTATALFRDIVDGLPHPPIAVLDATAATEGVYYPVTLFGLTRVLAYPRGGELEVQAGNALYWRGRYPYLTSYYGSATNTHLSMPPGLFAGWALETRSVYDDPPLVRAHFWPYCRLVVPAVGWDNYGYD